MESSLSLASSAVAPAPVAAPPGGRAPAGPPLPTAAPSGDGPVAEALPAVRPAELGRALVGWVALALVGLSASRGDLGAGVALTVAPPVGAVLLTVPALLVGHQYLNLRASPAALVMVLVRGFVGAGDVALGLAPLALLFSATSALGPAIVFGGMLGASLQGLLLAMRRLQDLEATQAPEDWSARGRMGLLVLAWASLFALIGLRLSWNLLSHLLS